MTARALSGRGEGTMHVKETRSSPGLAEMPEDFDAFLARATKDLSRLAPITRARCIYHRLALLTEHERRVLEAQFGCAHTLGEVSLALACMQAAAVEGHTAALKAARDRHERKFADQKRKATAAKPVPAKAPVKPADKPKPKLTGGSTVRDFLKVLCNAEESGAVLEQILEQARVELSAALDAYMRASRAAA